MTEATFKLIIKKIIKTDNNIFSNNYDKTDKVNKMIKIVFSSFFFKEFSVKNKFGFFYEIINNNFYKNINDEFIDYFYKIQKIYNGFNLLAKTFKYKKANIIVTKDMALNEININQKNVICIFHLNSKYLFTINDLINIINAALSNNDGFFSEPLCIKNPYNNNAFTKSILYNIYLFILLKTKYIPDLFFKFVQCDLNLTYFGQKYEIVLRDYYIKSYVNNSPLNILVTEVKNMISYFNKYCSKKKIKKIYIDNDFPKDKLVKIMKPYLLVYLTSKYSMVPFIKSNIDQILKNLLLNFLEFNPQFGRKKYKIVMGYTSDFKKKIIGKVLEFNDKHILFKENNVKSENFLTDHLLYSYNDNILPI
jgi:hypothetical protein